MRSTNTSWKTLRAKMSREQRAKLEQYRPDVRAQLALTQLRTSRKMTQVALAKYLDVDQTAVSRIEKRDDILLSSLNKYIAGLGGTLQLVASFPEGNVSLGEIGKAKLELTKSRKAKNAHRSTPDTNIARKAAKKVVSASGRAHRSATR